MRNEVKCLGSLLNIECDMMRLIMDQGWEGI